MSQTQNSLSRARPGLFIALFILLMSIYLSTYSGRIESGDSLRIMDSVNSLVNFGDTRRDESLAQEVPRFINEEEDFPFSIYPINEPLVLYIAAIPYSIAKILPSIGLVHSTWLVNIVVVALSAVLFFHLAQLLQYRTRTALIAAILFGIGTIVWAYSKTLFRDPIAMLFLLAAVVFLEHWRQGYKRIWFLGLAILAMLAAYYTKNSSLAALPALVLWCVPNITAQQWLSRLHKILLASGLIILGIITFIEPAFDVFVLLAKPFVFINPQFSRIALHSYLFSIGGSIWGTSPILLASLVGAGLLIAQEKYRLVWSVVILIIGYAFGHALFSSVHWFGGLSLPPRFMLPTIPFAMLLTLPVIAKIQESKSRTWGILFLLLAIFSIIVQIIFSLSLLDAYVQLLPPESNALVEWLPGLNRPQYLRWWLLPQSWNSLGWDIAWARIDMSYMMAAFIVLGLFSAATIFFTKFRTPVLLMTTIALMLLTGFGFTKLYQRDSLYWATTPELFDMLSILENEADPTEPVFMAGSADVTYERFFLNYNSLQNIRPVVLGFQAGERTSPSDSPAIVSDFNPDQLSVMMMRYMNHVISRQDRFWWLAHNGSFTEWAIRPEERYFAENYYLLNEYRTENPTVRLLEFSTIPAPSPYGFRLPDYLSMIRFGDHISLNGYTLPLGTSYQAGDVVPITLFWQTDTVLETNYTVSWFLVGSDNLNPIFQGVDSAPNAGFSSTLGWDVNQLVLDNRAIEIPNDSPVGDYQIWIRLYVSESGGAQQLAVTGSETYDDTTAILPIRIQVDNAN